jgi:hypothetical protein
VSETTAARTEKFKVNNTPPDCRFRDIRPCPIALDIFGDAHYADGQPSRTVVFIAQAFSSSNPLIYGASNFVAWGPLRSAKTRAAVSFACLPVFYFVDLAIVFFAWTRI